MKKVSKGLITALVLLIAALVVAYKHVEGFQTTPDTAPSGIFDYDVITSNAMGNSGNLYLYRDGVIYVLGFQNLPNQYLHIVKYSVDLATLPREGTVDVSTSPIYLQLIENASSFDVGFGSTTYIDNRYTGNTVQQITGMVPFYWSQPESKTNYLFSTELTLSNSAYLTEIAGQKYKITLYDMNNDIIKTNLPNTIPPGVGHVKFFFADPNEIRNSVQMADGTWQYVKLKIEDYVAPSQGTATVTSGTAGGVSAPTPASIPISFTVDQNTILIGFCIVAVLMLALRK